MKDILTKNNIAILLFVIFLSATGYLIYSINSDIIIGNYRIIISKEYKPIGKEIGNLKIRDTYNKVDQIEDNFYFDTDFIDKLKTFTFKEASYFTYWDLQKNEEIESWQFKLENNSSQSLVITTNPPINNPIYLQNAYNPQETQIRGNKIVITQKEKKSSILLISNNINQRTHKGIQNDVFIWIDGENISCEEAVVIASAFLN